MAPGRDERRQRALAARKQAVLAAATLLARLKALEGRMAGKKSGAAGVSVTAASTETINRLAAALDDGSEALSDLLCELARLLEELEHELAQEERRSAAMVMIELAGHVSESSSAAAVLAR